MGLALSKVLLENVWNSKQMFTEGEAAIRWRRLCTPSVIKRKQISTILLAILKQFCINWMIFDVVVVILARKTRLFLEQHLKPFFFVCENLYKTVSKKVGLVRI